MNHIRTHKRQLICSKADQCLMENTSRYYRRFVRHLIVLINNNWAILDGDISNLAIKKIENLIVPTKHNPNPKYQHFNQYFYKFPSYLRRAAIMDAVGQVSSFRTRYDAWLDEHKETDRPPRLNPECRSNPTLYKGNCYKKLSNDRVAIKLFDGVNWIWCEFNLRGSNRYQGTEMSPALVRKYKSWFLAYPTKIEVKSHKSSDCVLSVDIGINKSAVISVVNSSGTVIHREFFDRTDKDRQYQIRQRIRNSRKKSGGSCAKFCASHYRKLSYLATDQAHQISRKIVRLANHYNCTAIIMEDLKFWKPKSGKKGSNLKTKFHMWFKSSLMDKIRDKAALLGIKTCYVHPSNTSKYAFDGSGVVKRDERNATLARFTTGKCYHADLNAAYNIAARGIIKFFHPHLCEQMWSAGKPNVCLTTGNPLTLSAIWLIK